MDVVLGSLPGFVSLGEVGYVWHRGVLGNELCACGAPFHECPFWHEVGQRAYGGWRTPVAQELARLDSRVGAYRRILSTSTILGWAPAVVSKRRPKRYVQLLERYTAGLERLYEAIGDVSGASVLVDSTKRAGYGYLVCRMGRFETRFLHLVRDSRGMAFSHAKRVQRPEITDRVEFMPQYGALSSGVRWLLGNLLLEGVSRATPSSRMKYEEFASAPVSELSRICGALGADIPPGVAQTLEEGVLPPREIHAVSGNPIRMRRGSTKIRPDDAWRREMPLLQRAVVSASTAPLLYAYRYL